MRNISREKCFLVYRAVAWCARRHHGVLAQFRQFPVQQTGIVLIEFEQTTQVLEAVDIDMLPLQAPVAVIHPMGNRDAGVNRCVFTQEQAPVRKAYWYRCRGCRAVRPACP